MVEEKEKAPLLGLFSDLSRVASSVVVVPSCLYLWRAQLDNCELLLDS